MKIKGLSEPPPAGASLDEALRKARLAEAAHFDAVLDIRDAETLRLQVLKDEIEPIATARREGKEFIDLALIPGYPPRLWIDMVSYVIMAPDSRSYRFQRDTPAGHEILFETADRKEMVEKLTSYIAHRLIERQRALASPATDTRKAAPSYSGVTLILAWVSGFVLGVLVLFVALLLLSNLP